MVEGATQGLQLRRERQRRSLSPRCTTKLLQGLAWTSPPASKFAAWAPLFESSSSSFIRSPSCKSDHELLVTLVEKNGRLADVSTMLDVELAEFMLGEGQFCLTACFGSSFSSKAVACKTVDLMSPNLARFGIEDKE